MSENVDYRMMTQFLALIHLNAAATTTSNVIHCGHSMISGRSKAEDDWLRHEDGVSAAPPPPPPPAPAPSLQGQSGYVGRRRESGRYRHEARTATITIDKEDIKFSSGHFTMFSGTERERVHGHNFSVECSVECVVGDNGMAMDYEIIKSLLRQICSEWDERLLIPTESAYLEVVRDGTKIGLIFNGQKVLEVMEEEVQCLPIRNVTGEELSDYLTRYLEGALSRYVESGDILNISVSVSSSKGQSVTSSVRCNSTPKESATSPTPLVDLKSGESQRERGGAQKYAVITGGSGDGIGHEIALRFLENGYSVINLSRSKSVIDGVHSVPVDLCSRLKEEDLRMDPVIARMLSGDGQCELHLIHCASNSVADNIGECDAAEMEQSLMINSVNPAILSSMMLPLMGKGQRSSILFIGSTLSHKAVAQRLSYSVAKHAQIGLMKGITQDLIAAGERDVHSAVICPGFTDTKMLRSGVTEENRAEFEQFIASFVGLQRLIEPAEISRFVYEVAQCPILNGAVIDANGGQKEY